MLKNINRLIITNFQDIGFNTFYVDTEKELDGSYEFVFWDFKIPKWAVRFTTCLNEKFIVINNHAEKIARYFNFAYPNYYIEYEDYYVISVAIYARKYKFR